MTLVPATSSKPYARAALLEYATRSVDDAYAERSRLRVHALHGPFRRVRTLLVWRRLGPISIS